MSNKQKIKDGVEFGTYVDHLQGLDLLDIDLQDFALASYKDEMIPSYKKMAEQKLRIEHLEQVEADLLSENSIIRSKLYTCLDDCN